MAVLGIAVPDELLERWVGWFAPGRQPFLVPAEHPLATDEPCSAELRDTYALYGLGADVRLAWLDEDQFMGMPKTVRAELVRDQVRRRRSVVPAVRGWVSSVPEVRTQADGHRFVWWPRFVQERAITEFVTNDRSASRHGDVPASTWRAAESLLPRAHELAGTFPSASGPNCFGTVMAVAGVEGAEHEWLVREPFEHWLAAAPSGGADGDVGTVLVWRSKEGPDHAAVTLGDGWALHKPSQGWMSPVKVLPVDELKRRCRWPGLRLTRYRLAR
jgi:hypothetical protein